MLPPKGRAASLRGRRGSLSQVGTVLDRALRPGAGVLTQAVWLDHGACPMVRLADVLKPFRTEYERVKTQ